MTQTADHADYHGLSGKKHKFFPNTFLLTTIYYYYTQAKACGYHNLYLQGYCLRQSASGGNPCPTTINYKLSNI